MPKNILDIKNFDGGMNSHTNSRDIEENESALIQNGIVTHKGVIKTAYKKETISSFGTISYDPPDGTALWAYKTDYDKDNNEASSEFLLSGSNRYLKRFGNGWETKIDLSSAAGASTHLFPALVTYDGQIRFCDGSLNVDSNYQPITDAKIYGVFTRKYFNGSESTIELGSNVSASITKPDNGQLSIDSSTIDVTSSLRGYLGLTIEAKDNPLVSSLAVSTTNDNGTSNGTINDISGNSYQDDNRSTLGNATKNGSSFVDEFGESYLANDLVFGSLAGATVTSSGFDATLDNPQEGFYFYVTTGGEFAPNNYGKAYARNLELKVGGGSILAYDGASGSDGWYPADLRALGQLGTTASGANNWTLKYYVEAYNSSTETWVEQTLTNELFSNGFLKLRFNNSSDTRFRFKIRLISQTVVNPNNGQAITKVRVIIPDVNLKVYLEPNSGTSMLKFSSSGSSDMSVFWTNILPANSMTNDNMFAFKVALTDAKGGINGIRILLEENNSDYYSYDLNEVFISDNWQKGWVQVYAPFADFIKDGSPSSLSACNTLQLEVTGSSASNVFFDDFQIVEDKRGTWDGNYKFFYNWIYDRTQESSFFDFPNQGNGILLSDHRITAQSFIRELSAGGFSNGSTRITGANVYFAEYDNVAKTLKYNDPFLLMSIDFEKGISDPALEKIEFWKSSGDHKTHDLLEFIDPPFATNFSINSGYTYSFNNHIEKIRFRDATVMNRKIYYGNVDIVYEKREGETYPLREKYNDRIYKSLVNRPDVVPVYNYIDILVNDGDEITALESYADRLLVFKNDSMLLVNATRDVEFLEDNYQYKGVWNYAAIDKVPSGIAWANSFGAYYYDGEKIVELSDKKIDQTEWATSIGSKPTVVYEPKERHLIVANTNSDDGWVCDLDTMAWTKLVDFKDSNTTNIVFYDNNLTYGVYTSSLAFSKLVYDKTAGVNSKFSIITRDIDFGSSGTFIDFKKLYVTYKGTATNLTIQYRKNGSVSNNSLVGSFSTSLTGLSTVSFVPTDKSIAKNLHSLQFVLNSAQILLPNNIEIHDMSIVYRGKKVK